MRADTPSHVSAITGIFDLDHLGTKISQKHGPERAGTVLLNGDDANRL